MTDSQPLFEGQTTHPLSDAERKAFFKKINLSGRWFSFGDERKMRQALEFIIQTPTGAAQAREIIADPKKEFNISVAEWSDTRMAENDMNGMTVSKSKNIYIHSKMMHDNEIAALGNIILHECMHARNPHDKHTDNRILLDAETQALSFQMAYETQVGDKGTTNTQLRDKSYQNSFAVNYQKWLKIAQNPSNTPKGFIKFKPLPNIDKAMAMDAYAKQMAAQETQAQFIQDFLAAPQKMNATNHAMPFMSYGIISMRTEYDAQNAIVKETHGEVTISPAIIADLIERHQPFLNQSHFNGILNAPVPPNLSKEVRAKVKTSRLGVIALLACTDARGTDFKDELFKEMQKQLPRISEEDFPALLSQSIQCLVPEKDKSFLRKQGIFQKIEKGKDLSPDEQALTAFYMYKNMDLPNQTLKQFLSSLIQEHQFAKPKRCPARDRMIRDFEKIVGTELQFVQQNTGDVRGTLRDASHEPATPPVGRTTGREGIA